VVATTFTICAVFIPVAFMGGIAGEFFLPFGFTVTIAVLFSLLVARMLTPMMAAYFLKPHLHDDKESRYITWYLKKVNWCLKNRGKVVLVSSIVMVAMLSLYRFLPTGFAPAGNNGFTQMSVELPPGSRIEDTLRVSEEARKIIAAMPEVKSVYTSIGGGSSGAVRNGSLTIQLDNPHGITTLQQDFERKATVAVRSIAGAKVQFSGAGGDRFQLTLVGENSDLLNLAAGNVEREMRNIEGLGAVNSSASLKKPEIEIRPDAERAAALGVTNYTLYWSTTSPVTLASSKISNVVSTYVQSGLTNGTRYYYALTSTNSKCVPSKPVAEMYHVGPISPPVTAPNTRLTMTACPTVR
jgi:multidrug efflux pump subunit AcrB